MFKMKKITAIAAATVMALSTMAVCVSASTADGQATARSVEDIWTCAAPVNRAPNSRDIGTVTGLIQGVDTGITFKVTNFNNPLNTTIFAAGFVKDSALCLYQDDYAYLTYDGDYGTVLFQRDWYSLCNGSVDYYVLAYDMTPYSGQEISGKAY